MNDIQQFFSLTSVLLGKMYTDFPGFYSILQLRSDTKLRLVYNFQQDDSTNSYHIITTIHKFLNMSRDLKQPSEKSDSDIK
jgi:hypothetical protein